MYIRYTHKSTYTLLRFKRTHKLFIFIVMTGLSSWLEKRLFQRKCIDWNIMCHKQALHTLFKVHTELCHRVWSFKKKKDSEIRLMQGWEPKGKTLNINRPSWVREGFMRRTGEEHHGNEIETGRSVAVSTNSRQSVPFSVPTPQPQTTCNTRPWDPAGPRLG